MENVLPTFKEWTIGEKNYKQEPFGLDRTAAILPLIGDALNSLDGKQKDTILKMDTKKLDFFTLIAMLAKAAPEALKGFIVLCLDVTNDQDVANIKKNTTPRQMMGIITEFVKTNDINGLKEDFLEFRKALSEKM